MQKYIRKLKIGFGLVALATTAISQATLQSDFEQLKKSIHAIDKWVDGFFDLTSKKTFNTCRQELQNDIIPLLNILVGSKTVGCSQAEQELYVLAQILDNKFRATLVALGSSRNFIIIGFNLRDTCYLPEILDTISLQLDKIIAHAQAENSVSATQIATFKKGFFQKFYNKWYSQKPTYYIKALKFRWFCK